MYPDDLRYTKEHEWIRAEGGVWTVGITAHAADLLGDVTYVEPAEPGQKVKQGQSVSAVESVKAASDVYAPCGGTVSEANSRLEEEPDLVNTDPYGEGWFYKLEDVKETEYNALMDAAAYEKYVEELEDE